MNKPNNALDMQVFVSRLNHDHPDRSKGVYLASSGYLSVYAGSLSEVLHKLAEAVEEDYKQMVEERNRK